MITRIVVAVVVWRVVRRLALAALAIGIAITLLHHASRGLPHHGRHTTDPVKVIERSIQHAIGIESRP